MMAPTRLWPLAVTPILSPLGKLRAAMEYFIPPRADDADESMAHFVRRRLGREAFERLVEPLVSAVYAADLEKLSVLATLPRFREMERDFGSLIRAMRHQMRNRPKSSGESGARYSMFVTLRDGLSSLVDAIAARLPPGAVRLNTAVTRIERCEMGWRVSIAKPQAASLQISKSPNLQILKSSNLQIPSTFDALILATPSPVSAALLQPLDAALAADLASIEHSGTAILSLGYRSDQIGHPLDGMGAVVPAAERSPILAVSFSSRKYAHRAPEGKTLLRVFVGGARRPEVVAMSDAELTPLVLDELTRLLQIRGQPCYRNIARWPGTMPQYHVGHKELVARIETRVAALPNLALGRQRLSRRRPARLHPRRRTGGRADSGVGLAVGKSPNAMVERDKRLTPPFTLPPACPRGSQSSRQRECWSSCYRQSQTRMDDRREKRRSCC